MVFQFPKDYLKAHITEQSYYWLENKTVTSKIRDLARVKYMETGYSKAKKAIDDMPAEKVKDYLKTHQQKLYLLLLYL